MKKILLSVAVTALLIMAGSGAALAEYAVIVSQEGAPLKILNYESEYDVTDKKPLIEHNIKYQNIGEAKIVSARFGILEYNGYGEILDAFCGYTNETSSKGEKDSATFIDVADHSRFFEDYGQAFVWADAVRYEDSKIWKSDKAQLLIELQKFKPELKEADLIEKKCIPAD